MMYIYIYRMIIDTQEFEAFLLLTLPQGFGESGQKGVSRICH